MITIDEAVRLELDSFISENVVLINEKDKYKKGKKNSGGKNAIKKKGGGRKDIDYTSDARSNPNISQADQGDLTKILDSPLINQSEVASELYPDHTKEGAQSQLRKKVKGLKSDSGSKYKIKRKEARRLRRILARMLKF